MEAQLIILPGDGIGPEVAAEAVKVLHAIEKRFGHTFALETRHIGGSAIDHEGVAVSDATLARCQGADAVWLGAVGGPKWDGGKVRPEQGLLALRRALGTFANIRPVKVFPQVADASPIKLDRLLGVDMVVCRELTGGIYFGDKFRDENSATDVCMYTVHEIERIVRMACTMAMGRRKKLTSVDKANVLETSRLWREITTRVVRDEFPEITLEHVLVDSAAMHLIQKPASFDVIVTENMFGDILTDEASVLAGSMGLLASASLGAGRCGLYEPIHGSAPDIAGQNKANPYASILSVALMLRYSLGLEHEAVIVEDVVSECLDDGVRTADLVKPGDKAASTAQAGDAVASRISNFAR